jgi:SSS family transporter
VVATETSTLTVIGIPAVAYMGAFTFLQLAIGYIFGRFVVAYVLLPRYFRGEMKTAYAYLGERFGPGMRSTASVTFLVTRLLADGVRLFATTIPLKLIADASGWNVSYGSIIVLIGLVTIAYTLVGGIRAVVWMDVVQMFIYVGGALMAAALLVGSSPDDWWETARVAGKTQVLDFTSNFPLRSLLTSPYAFVTAVVGGAVLSIASHGSDHLIVQRLLSCKTLADGKRALIASGFVVAAQFALFLLLGVLLWSHYEGLTPLQLGLTRADEIFPYYILTSMPTGIAGLLVAGIVAAAMSTLSSSLNSLASSTVFDLEPIWRPLKRRFDRLGERSDLWLGRLLTGFWGLVFMVFASLFTEIENSVVVLGLSIASFTYGGLLGGFVLGIVNPRATQRDAIVALVVAIAAMLLIGLIRVSPDGSFGITFIGFGNSMVPNTWKAIAWPWYPVIGTSISVLTGSLLALRHPTGK